jgi:hypothetical protein
MVCFSYPQHMSSSNNSYIAMCVRFYYLKEGNRERERRVSSSVMIRLLLIVMRYDDALRGITASTYFQGVQLKRNFRRSLKGSTSFPQFALKSSIALCLTHGAPKIMCNCGNTRKTSEASSLDTLRKCGEEI